MGSVNKKEFPEEGDVAHSTHFRTFVCLVIKEINAEKWSVVLYFAKINTEVHEET